MVKKCLWTGICILALGIGSAVNATDMEAVLEGNTSSTGFSVKDSSSNTLMRVQGDGNVGIGTTAPNGRLTVEGPDGDTCLLVDKDGTGGTFFPSDDPVGLAVVDGLVSSQPVDAGFRFIETSSDASLITALRIHNPRDVEYNIGVNGTTLYLGDSSTSLQGLRPFVLDKSGNVGIGTTAPAAGLHVKGKRIRIEDSTSPTLDFFLGSSNHGQIWGGTQDGVEGLHIGPVESGRDLALYTRSGSNLTQTMVLNDGKIGIGTTAPTAKLHVTGDIIHTGSISQASSRELKKDISYISDEEAMSALQGIKPVKYKYKVDNSQEEHLGFIAEDVPALVANQGRKTLSTMDLTAMLTKVVQEQQKMLQDQKETIDAMKQEMEIMKSFMNYGVKGL